MRLPALLFLAATAHGGCQNEAPPPAPAPVVVQQVREAPARFTITSTGTTAFLLNTETGASYRWCMDKTGSYWCPMQAMGGTPAVFAAPH